MSNVWAALGAVLSRRAALGGGGPLSPDKGDVPNTGLGTWLLSASECMASLHIFFGVCFPLLSSIYFFLSAF